MNKYGVLLQIFTTYKHISMILFAINLDINLTYARLYITYRLIVRRVISTG